MKFILQLILLQFLCTALYCQAKKSLYKVYIDKEDRSNYFGTILISKEGPILISSSQYSFAIITGGNIGAFTIGLDNQDYGIKNLENVFSGGPLKALTESSDDYIFFATAKNQITYFQNSEKGICDLPPFYFPLKGDVQQDITTLWFDNENNLYIGAVKDAFYMVPKAGTDQSLNPKNYKIAKAADGSMLIQKGELPVQKNFVGSGAGVYAFAENFFNKNIVWIGTSKGLYTYNKTTKEIKRIASSDSTITITHIEALNNGDIWFSTLEKGMGVYHQTKGKEEFFSYPKRKASANTSYPIQSFCVKSPDDFFVAVKDSTPAIFNIANHSYNFLNDSSFVSSKNNTTDIKLDSSGNFYFIKGGLLYSANISDNKDWRGSSQGNIQYTPLIYGVTDFNRREITNYLTKPEMLKNLKLGYKENSIIIYLTSNYYSGNKAIQYEWKLDGDSPNWVAMPVYDTNNDSSNNIELPGLKSGKYLLHVKVRIGSGVWSKNEALMKIVVAAPFWAAWWFWLSVFVALSIITFVAVRFRINAIRKRDRVKVKYEREALELEAKALRAQMNPHFIFNCMNSIKSLIQQKDEDNAVNYLTTFSKLLRTVLQNCDKREITLFDEIEMCRLYTQLENMRFGKRLNYYFNIDENADLKSIMVPTLILQPFIENAIWHGIMPKEKGGDLIITVEKKDETIVCIIDDDGIGREMSKQYKFKNDDAHQSKGLHITQTRLSVDNLLNERKATVEIIDKKDEDGKSTGTKVVLVFVED